jgi:hypothetical protein
MNKPPCECFDDGWKIPAFPRSSKDVVSLGKNAPRSLLRGLKEVLGREVLVDLLSGADAIPGGLPMENIPLIIRN